MTWHPCKASEHAIANILKETYNVQIVLAENQPYAMVCAADIGRALQLSNVRKSIVSYGAAYKAKSVIQTRGGPQNVAFLTILGLQKLLSSCRTPATSHVVQAIGLHTDDIIFPCTESQTLQCIMEAFKGETMLPQYTVGKYRVDLYFPHYNLAIECDELHHRCSHDKDAARQREITEMINCTFIRYAPEEKNFNIFEVVNAIFHHIKCCYA